MLYRKMYLHYLQIQFIGGMPGLQNVMRQLQQGAGGGLGNLMGGLGK